MYQRTHLSRTYTFRAHTLPTHTPHHTLPFLYLCFTTFSPYTNTFAVWKMSPLLWTQRGDPQLRGPYHQKIPKVVANLEWEAVQNVSSSCTTVFVVYVQNVCVIQYV